MTIRRRVLDWVKTKDIRIDGDLRTSKYYPVEQSRSKRPAWWVEVPVDKVCKVDTFEVFCEKGVEGQDFHHLAVPSAFLEENQGNFCITNGKISLWLSADEADLFQDTHPKGRQVDFRRFVIA